MLASRARRGAASICLHWTTFGSLCTIGLISTLLILQVDHQRRMAAEGGAGRRSPLEAVVVPAEAPGMSLLQDDKRALAAAGAALESPAAFLPSRQFSFPAEGPLDAVVRGAGAGLDSDEEGAGESHPSCTDVHPNADSPNMLHVVYASDTSQVEGVQASVASVVASTANPEELTVHIMVQRKWSKDFKERFGLRRECQGTVTVTGVLIRVHDVDGQLIQRSVAKVSDGVIRERGAIDSLENFARFYMDLILEHTVVVYLDADTIVQADLAELRKQLVESGKTIGFVAREGTVHMDKFLRKPNNCKVHIRNYSKIFSMTAYNVGVFAVNLQRWKDLKMAERVEDLVSQHNACHGKLWIGGSQPPLLLAFLSRPPGAPEDFIVFDAAWNTVDLGWRPNMNAKKLRTRYVLHWNGNLKPWKPDGLYREIWQPHRERFNSLLRPYDEDGSGGSTSQPPAGARRGGGRGKKKKATTTTESPEELAAQAACPGVRLLDEWTEEAGQCKIGSSFGCRDGPSGGMWAKRGCTGVFGVDGKVTTCGGSYGSACLAGTLPPPKYRCGLMILTSFFTTKKDWQRGKFAEASFSKIHKLYETVIKRGLNVSVIYDSLPDGFVERYSCGYFRFIRVDLEEFDSRYGVNDVRYFFFERLVVEHHDWKYVFIVDAFDVRIGMNPCAKIRDQKLYVGHEMDKLKTHPWMRARFMKMGGKYLKWYQNKVTDKMKILNCGITGGGRKVMLELLQRMTEVLRDPAIGIMQKKEDINLNMAALNYIVYTEFTKRFTGGPPVHSLYKRYETGRRDVWFIHK